MSETVRADRGGGDRPLPHGATHDDRRSPGATGPGGLRHLRARQRHLPGTGPARRSRRVADVARPERAGNGVGGDRLRQSDAASPADGGHDIDRSGCPQPRHRCRRGDGQSSARATARRRHLSEPPAGSGAAAGRTLRQPVDDGQRRLPFRRSLLGPDHPSGASDPVTAAGDRHDARPGRLRTSVHRLAPGCARRVVRLPARAVRASRPRRRAATARHRPARRGPGRPA